MNEFASRVWEIITRNNVLSLAGALAILPAGWIVALIVRKWVTAAFRKHAVNKKLGACLPEEEAGKAGVLEKIVAGVFFWGILLLTLLACLSALKLPEAAAPVQKILEKILAFLPNMIAAVFLCFAAWFVASALKYLTRILLSALKLDQKIEKVCETGGKECDLSSTITTVIYALSWLFFFPAILNALKIQGITRPLEEMLARILNYLPNLAAAAAIAFFGFLAAGFLKKITHRLLSANAPENSGAGKTAPAGFPGLAKAAGPISGIVYALVAIPVAAAALDALKIKILAGSAGKLFSKILNASGDIFGALLLIFIAWAAGSFLANLTARMLSGKGFNKLFRALGFQQENAPESGFPAESAGKIVFATVLIFGVIGAFEILDFRVLANLLREFVPFAAHLLLGSAVFLFGVYLSKLAAGSMNARNQTSSLPALAVRVLILFFAGALALHCTGIGGPIIETAFTLILGAVAVAFAIAFGIGGRKFAAKKLEEWSKKKKPDDTPEDPE